MGSLIRYRDIWNIKRLRIRHAIDRVGENLPERGDVDVLRRESDLIEILASSRVVVVPGEHSAETLAEGRCRDCQQEREQYNPSKKGQNGIHYSSLITTMWLGITARVGPKQSASSRSASGTVRRDDARK